MNAINLTGNICNDLELKTTLSDKIVCSFNIAVKRPFAKEITDFFTVVCWNRQAENVCKYCSKGSKIGVTGTLTARKWEDKDGNNRISYEIVANEIDFLEKKTDVQPERVNENPAPSELFDEFADIINEDLPF